MKIVLTITLCLTMFGLAAAHSNFSQLQQQVLSDDGITVIEREVKTKKQRAHGKLFKENARDISDSQVPGEEVTVSIEIEPPFIPPGSAAVPVTLQPAFCKADAVVVGTVVGKVSQLAEGDSFIFSEHAFVVDEVLKSDAATPITEGASITVVRSGGEVRLNGHTYRADKSDFKRFTRGERYLLLLRSIRETGDYCAYGNGSFGLKCEQVEPLGNDPRLERLFEGKTATAFLAGVRGNTAAGCHR